MFADSSHLLPFLLRLYCRNGSSCLPLQCSKDAFLYDRKKAHKKRTCIGFIIITYISKFGQADFRKKRLIFAQKSAPNWVICAKLPKECFPLVKTPPAHMQAASKHAGLFLISQIPNRFSFGKRFRNVQNSLVCAAPEIQIYAAQTFLISAIYQQVELGQ